MWESLIKAYDKEKDNIFIVKAQFLKVIGKMTRKQKVNLYYSMEIYLKDNFVII